MIKLFGFFFFLLSSIRQSCTYTLWLCGSEYIHSFKSHNGRDCAMFLVFKTQFISCSFFISSSSTFIARTWMFWFTHRKIAILLQHKIDLCSLLSSYFVFTQNVMPRRSISPNFTKKNLNKHFLLPTSFWCFIIKESFSLCQQFKHIDEWIFSSFLVSARFAH